MAPDWGYFRTVPGSSRDRALSHVYVTAESTLLTARILDTNTLSLLAAKRALDGTISTDLRVFAEEIRAIAGDVDGTSKGGFFNYSARLQRRQLMEVVVRVGNNNSRAPTPLFSPPAATYKSAVHLRTVDTGLTFNGIHSQPTFFSYSSQQTIHVCLTVEHSHIWKPVFFA